MPGIFPRWTWHSDESYKQCKWPVGVAQCGQMRVLLKLVTLRNSSVKQVTFWLFGHGKCKKEIVLFCFLRKSISDQTHHGVLHSFPDIFFGEEVLTILISTCHAELIVMPKKSQALFSGDWAPEHRTLIWISLACIELNFPDILKLQRQQVFSFWNSVTFVLQLF